MDRHPCYLSDTGGINYIIPCQASEPLANCRESSLVYLQTLVNVDISPSLLLAIKIELNKNRDKQATLNICSYSTEVRQTISNQRLIW